MTIFRERIPGQEDIFYVFGGIVFGVYSWAIRGFLYQVSSLRLYHTLGEILAIFAYVMAYALLESLVIMAFLILVGFSLPGKWFREGFAYKGFITTVVTGAAMIILHYYLHSLNYELPSMRLIYLGMGITMILLVSLLWFIQNRPPLQKVLLAAQERLQIFVYFYIPLGILGLAVVLLRNLR